MKDFLLIFVFVGALGYLSTFLGAFGLLVFAAAVIAAVFTFLIKLWFQVEVMQDKLDKLLEKEEEQT